MLVTPLIIQTQILSLPDCCSKTSFTVFLTAFIAGTVYGQGCYFARDASYSNRYADSKPIKYMYLVRILVGEFTQGASHMVVAPPKNTSSDALPYDSVVDNTSNPTIFVVFYDADAYPEYLITYTT